MVNFENLNKRQFDGVGKYGFPRIAPVQTLPTGSFIPMNYAKTAKSQENKVVHCFVDDYQFVRYWNQPDTYIPLLRKFQAVFSPDFSLYTDMPTAMQIYNHYRKHWLAAYWQENGITVYPSISWSTPDSFDWCFDGEPQNGIVAVSSIGTQRNAESRQLFLQGYEEMMKRLSPTWVLFYGAVPPECEWHAVSIPSFTDTISQRTHNADR